MHAKVVSAAPAVSGTKTHVLAALLAGLLGAALLWGVGFAGPEVIHNAAHDGRHAHAFPCH